MCAPLPAAAEDLSQQPPAANFTAAEGSASEASAEACPSDSSPEESAQQDETADAEQPDSAASKELVWQNEQQKAQCEDLLEELLELFRKARFYSIQGDSCRTALFSKSFLERVEVCRKECPKGFLENMGFNAGIIRNVETLRDLGTQRCADGK